MIDSRGNDPRRRMPHTFIGDDHPPGYRKVGTIDVADPADVQRAQDRGYKIGTTYNGGSFSCAEPCAADIYARPDEEDDWNE
jgi:hypothetical protein